MTRRLLVALALAAVVAGPGCSAREALSGLPGAVVGVFSEQSPQSAVYELVEARKTLQAAINMLTAAGTIDVATGRQLTETLKAADPFLEAARLLVMSGGDPSLELAAAEGIIEQVEAEKDVATGGEP